MITILVLTALMIGLDVAAVRWGVDSRLVGGDWQLRAGGLSS